MRSLWTGEMIPDGYTDLPPGKLAAVVTYLEMTAFGPMPVAVPPPGFTLRCVEHPEADWYRTLFRKVGEAWLWFGRLRMADAELIEILHDPRVDVYALERGGEAVGLLELDLRKADEMELAYLGVAHDVIGKGTGRFLMDFAIAEAIQHSTARFWVHTCTLDHPSALAFYIRSGFRPYKRAIEVFDDPRLTGDLPSDAAPHIPLLER